ncbi:TonB family protein [Pseudoxanthomonas putridarboris]|uniref:TonB family protein n=1 Tax=Pseudoxanthomonas putridarboris TaxID=752605 RepID=A0ABU9IY53_9GAMM
MVRALPFRPDSRIDFGRVAAIAAAIALHAAALLMLLMPMAAPPIAAVAKPKPIVQWYDKEVIKPEVVPVVEERKITPVRETPKVVQTRPTIAPPVAETQVIVDGGTEAVIETPAESTGDVAGPAITTGPIASASLEYVKASAPRYPIAEIRNGVQGTVMLRVLVDTDGTPIDVQIEKSSGNRNLDKEARQHVLRTWRFKPALRDGVPVQAYGLVPIDFSLQ